MSAAVDAYIADFRVRVAVVTTAAFQAMKTAAPDTGRESLTRFEIGDRAYALLRTPEEGQALLEDYEDAVRVRDGVEAGVVHWSEVEPELVGPRYSEDAFDIAAGRADDAAYALLAGRL
jgi:hypothetical protein